MGTKLSPPKSNPFGTSFEALDIGLGYFIFKFDNPADHDKKFTRGPWSIMDHYLTVRKWCPNFKPSEAEEVTTVVWVRFPDLAAVYYNEKLYTLIRGKIHTC